MERDGGEGWRREGGQGEEAAVVVGMAKAMRKQRGPSGRREAAQVQREEAGRRLAWYWQRRAAWITCLCVCVCVCVCVCT